MNHVIANSSTIGVVISILGYEIGLFLKNKYRSSLLNPLLISIAFVMIFILIFHIDYESYNSSAKYLSYLLTPATVCLAIPLYQQLKLLKENFVAVMLGILAGVLTSVTSVWILAMLFQFSHEEYVTLLPKSITTAIGMGVSEELGGIVNITVAVIIITGVLGNIIAEVVLKIFRITSPIAKGVAIGSASHAIGTVRAMEMGEIEGAMSSLAIVVTGLCTTIAASVFANLL